MARRENKRQLRCQRADERETAAAGRTPQAQLARLDARLGVGAGAQRERARLAARIAASA